MTILKEWIPLMLSILAVGISIWSSISSHRSATSSNKSASEAEKANFYTRLQGLISLKSIYQYQLEKEEEFDREKRESIENGDALRLYQTSENITGKNIEEWLLLSIQVDQKISEYHDFLV